MHLAKREDIFVCCSVKTVHIIGVKQLFEKNINHH